MVVLLVAGGLLGAGPAGAVAPDCPPNCDRIPDSAWIAPVAIPLYHVYRWPELAPLAVSVTSPRLRLEEECATPPVPYDPRDYAVAARATVAQPDGDWQLQVQVVHWRGETWRGAQLVTAVYNGARTALRACQLTAPRTSPSITTDLPGRLAAVISVDGRRVLRQYLIADTRNSTLVELSMWASSPPRVPWPAVPDAQVLDALVAPLCRAYIDSCR